jgi:hypothetical protein
MNPCVCTLFDANSIAPIAESASLHVLVNGAIAGNLHALLAIYP